MVSQKEKQPQTWLSFELTFNTTTPFHSLNYHHHPLPVWINTTTFPVATTRRASLLWQSRRHLVSRGHPLLSRLWKVPAFYHVFGYTMYLVFGITLYCLVFGRCFSYFLVGRLVLGWYVVLVFWYVLFFLVIHLIVLIRLFSYCWTIIHLTCFALCRIMRSNCSRK